MTLWYDQLLQGGEDWRDGIVKALSQSKVLVILFSDASNSSIQLIKELAVADSVGKTVIPVLIENTEPREMTIRSGTLESVVIRLSVTPSLR